MLRVNFHVWRKLALVVGAVSAATNAYACSIFAAATPDAVLAANNEDFYFDVTPKVWVTPPRDSERGRVCLGFGKEHSDPFAQGGMNDAGLFFDAAVTPKEKLKRTKGRPQPPRNLGDRMLAECATVKEAVAWLSRYDLDWLNGGHFLIADATGDAAVVELDGMQVKLFQKKSGNYVAATNFSFTNPALGNYPCPRFHSIDDYFKKQQGPVSEAGFRDLLSRVAVKRTLDEKTGKDGGTLYSNICDLKGRTITLYQESRFDEPARYSLSSLFEKGERAYALEELFH